LSAREPVFCWLIAFGVAAHEGRFLQDLASNFAGSFPGNSMLPRTKIRDRNGAQLPGIGRQNPASPHT
jgi:hypothetical protein